MFNTNFFQEFEKHGLMELFFVCDNMEGLGKYKMADTSGIYFHLLFNYLKKNDDVKKILENSSLPLFWFSTLILFSLTC